MGGEFQSGVPLHYRCCGSVRAAGHHRPWKKSPQEITVQLAADDQASSTPATEEISGHCSSPTSSPGHPLAASFTSKSTSKSTTLTEVPITTTVSTPGASPVLYTTPPNTPSPAISQADLIPAAATAATGVNSQSNIRVKLPALQLQHFHGDILKWTELWQAFESTVHDNAKLPDVAKLTY
eukprot:scpid89803/ scgid7144/ 